MSEPSAASPDVRRNTLKLVRQLVLGALLGAAVGLFLRKRSPSAAPRPHDLAGWLAALRTSGFNGPELLSLLLWVVFSLYWSWAARNASAARVSETRASRAVHLVIVSVGQMLVILPVWGLRARLWPDVPAVVWFGMAVNVAALALAVWARQTLGRHWSGEITTKVDHELITRGPYALVRHPIYSAVLGLCLGTTLVWGELHALLGTVLVMVAYARKIRLEEANLDQAFGPQWAGYRARTKALIPGVY